MDGMDNPIIRFRQPANQTSPDYREKFSLNAKHIRELKAISEQIKDDKTIEYLLIVLLVVLSFRNNFENDDILSKVDNLLKNVIENKDPFAKINNLINMIEKEPRSNYCNISLFESRQNDYGNIISVFGTILGCSIIQLDELVNEMIDITAIRKNEWEDVRISTKTPKQNRTIEDVEHSCYNNTRFTPDELRTLLLPTINSLLKNV